MIPNPKHKEDIDYDTVISALLDSERKPSKSRNKHFKSSKQYKEMYEREHIQNKPLEGLEVLFRECSTEAVQKENSLMMPCLDPTLSTPAVERNIWISEWERKHLEEESEHKKTKALQTPTVFQDEESRCNSSDEKSESQSSQPFWYGLHHKWPVAEWCGYLCGTTIYQRW